MHALRDIFYRKVAAAPLREPAGERPHTLDASAVQSERRTGARSFVRSSAVEDNVPVAWDFILSRFEFSGRHHQGPRQLRAFGFNVQRIPEIDYH